MLLKTGFGERDVVLDAAEDFVVDGVLVAQADDALKLLDTDINRNQLGGALLLDPVARMRVANNLPRFFVDVILSLAFISVLKPAPRFHILSDLCGLRMSALDVLHACDYARSWIPSA
jgi:hypothetical protein